MISRKEALEKLCESSRKPHTPEELLEKLQSERIATARILGGRPERSLTPEELQEERIVTARMLTPSHKIDIDAARETARLFSCFKSEH